MKTKQTELWLVRDIFGDYQLYFGKPRSAAGDWKGGTLITTWPKSSFQRMYPDLVMDICDSPRSVRLVPA